MRKLVLHCLLGGSLLLALVLEHFLTTVPPEGSANRLVLRLGADAPRIVPETPPRSWQRAAPQEPGSRAPSATDPDAEEQGRPRPIPAGPPPVAVPAELQTHVVASGETLSGIAQHYLGSSGRWRELASFNEIEEPSRIRPGTELLIPPSADQARAPTRASPEPQQPVTPGRVHTVGRGETLSDIARRYLGDARRWRDIQNLNEISKPSLLQEGLVLRLPSD